MKRKTLFLVGLLFCVFTSFLKAQVVSVKSNLLYDLTATVNLGVELKLSHNWTVDLSGNLNAWTLGKNNNKWKHFLIQPEVRYWFCSAFNRHFVGVHGLWINYNVGGLKLPFTSSGGLRTNRYRGDAYGAGVSYGYQWPLSHSWSMEANVGIGYLYMKDKSYHYQRGGAFLGNNTRSYFGPTKLGLSLIYIIK